jgi:hypothetical protein
LIKAQIIVVRVYQCRRNGAIAGVLETADGGEQKAFRSFRELRSAMLVSLKKTPLAARPVRKHIGET